jgi:hypothetical protein
LRGEERRGSERNKREGRGSERNERGSERKEIF